ncbi:DUF1559 domain-containing protein [Roseimaritima ulvae]|uniref:DUF1559 domain-containing protein n=1 Tax=Roseimaritima ulvae TaxID=980254 RepID=A0A5B9R9N0_9BACT|nr:DUF1559 domain-containing protein [Roseimaritima ulvae]QEG43543.1 hypothetical protein UC8_55940 [Roseimaritima ulvae]
MNHPLRLFAHTLCALTITCSVASAQQPGTTASEAPQRTYLSNEYIPSDAMLAVFGSPKDILSAPELEIVPVEILQAQMLQEIGVDPMHIEHVTIVAGVPGPSGPPAGAVIKLTQDYDISDLNQRMFLDTEPQDVGGREVYVINGPPGTVLFRRDARTFVIGIGGYLEFMLDANNEDGQLPQLVTKIPDQGGLTAVAVMEPVRPMLTGMLKQNAGPMPPPLQGLVRLPELTNAVLVNLQPRGLMDAQMMVVALCTDDTAAADMEKILNQAIDFGRDQFRQEMTRNADSEDPIQQATVQYFKRISTTFSDMLRPTRTGNRLTIRTKGNMASTGVLVGIMLPAVQAARGAARRMSAVNNMKQLGLAMHNHHAAFNQLPDTAIRDENGKPLLSWRVKVLPFIEEQALYEQFHLDEPWDSEHNIQLLDKMPQTYDHPALPLPPGQTVFQLPVGEGLMFDGKKATSFRNILDGLSNTIMIVEADEASAVPWTKPVDAEIDLTDPAANLSRRNGGGFLTTLGDGAVRDVPPLNAERLKALFTRDGGEVIEGF